MYIVAICPVNASGLLVLVLSQHLHIVRVAHGAFSCDGAEPMMMDWSRCGPDSSVGVCASSRLDIDAYVGR
jgi:hypothetical protein